jgi:LPS-assembly protein
MRNTLLGALLVALGALGRADPAWAGRVDEAGVTSALPEMEDPLPLRRAPRLDPMPVGSASTELPIFLRSDAIDGFLRGAITATGQAEIRQRGLSILADQLRYIVPDEKCIAEGHVEIHRGPDVVTGPSAEFNLRDQSGQVQEPLLQMAPAPGRVRAGRASAALVVFPDSMHEHLDQATYTTCSIGHDDWFLTGSTLDLDRTTQIGQARNARIVFQGVPLLYSPYMSFPLNDQRKSGFLAPTIGTTANNGIDISQPYYFNIAQNLDDTLTARLMSKRGIQLADEFRYLEPSYSGIVNAELLDHDLLAGTRRYSFGIAHEENLPYGIHFHAAAQEVSDSAYFRDLSTLVTATSTTYLPRDFMLSRSGPGWALSARTLSYQTIRDPAVTVVDQYRMLPQLIANYSTRYHGAVVSIQNEYADFRHPSLTQGQRYVTYPSLAVPLVRDWGYITPKIGYHFTGYETDALPASGLLPQRITRGLPISSVDSGLFFERDMSLAGRQMVQTLEPRLYYVNIPYRKQDQLPVFNTGVAELSYSQLFTENQFSGPDRINDASQLTAAIQSRVVDPQTGVETIRAVVGQRFYYRAQGVILPGQLARTDNVSDVIASLTGRVLDSVQAEISSDYSPSLRRTEKFVLAGHYRPEPGRALNLGYRINRDTPGQPDVRQIDFSTEWPIGGRWTGVMRINYDTAQSTLVEGLAGAEYTAGCWVFRIVAHRLAVSAAQTSSAVFMQLELNGLARLGTNPLDTLRLNIPGYVKSNEIPQ